MVCIRCSARLIHPPASIERELRSSSILPVHLHKDCMTAEMANQVQGWLRHNHGRPYMCKACSTLEVIARGPCAACGMAGKNPQPTREPELQPSLLATAMVQAATAEQSLLLSNRRSHHVPLNVSSRPKCYGTSGRPSAPGMVGGQQHVSSLCTGCRYEKRYQEWACIACGATGTLCCHQTQQDTSQFSCAQAVID